LIFSALIAQGIPANDRRVDVEMEALLIESRDHEFLLAYQLIHYQTEFAVARER